MRSRCRRCSPASSSSTGDLLRIETPSSAGYGDPLQRDPAAVGEDYLDGFFDADEALRSYGVVLRADGAVDVDATQRERAARAG